MNDTGGLMNFADPNFEDLRSQNHSLQGMAEYAAWLRSVSVGAEPTRTVVASYVNYRQRPQATGHFAAVLRTDQELSAVIPAAREIIRSLDPDLPPSFGTLGQFVNTSLQPRRFNLMIVGAFASTALLLAMTGIYGLTAYSVARRTHEMGVRLAVGAGPADILRLVLGQGVVTVAVGVAIGACGSVAFTRTMESLLFGVTARDPATFVGRAVLLTLAALLGCYFPARRATKVDPIVALRYERL